MLKIFVSLLFSNPIQWLLPFAFLSILSLTFMPSIKFRHLFAVSFDPSVHYPAKADSRRKGLQLRLDHLRLCKLHHWHRFHPCIALDLAVQIDLGRCPARLIRSTLHQVGQWPVESSRTRASALTRPPSPNPQYIRYSDDWPCTKSCLVGDRDKALHFQHCSPISMFWHKSPSLSTIFYMRSN